MRHSRHSKTIIVAIAALTVVLFLIVNPFNGEKEQNQYADVDFSSGLVVKAEVAETPEKQNFGLMNRTSLGEKEGMLFIFPVTKVQNFWMKNMLMPLDMIFIAENGTIVKIHYAVPCKQDPCPIYNSEKPAMYVVEVNFDFTRQYGVDVGDVVEIRR